MSFMSSSLFEYPVPRRHLYVAGESDPARESLHWVDALVPLYAHFVLVLSPQGLAAGKDAQSAAPTQTVAPTSTGDRKLGATGRFEKGGAGRHANAPARRAKAHEDCHECDHTRVAAPIQAPAWRGSTRSIS